MNQRIGQSGTWARRAVIGVCLGAAAALSVPAMAQTKAPAKAAAKATGQKVKFETSLGNFVVQLDEQAAPKTVANFVQYVKDGQYTNTIFHRVIPTFMVQGGGFAADMSEKPTRPPIPLESKNGLKNVRGSIAMARTNRPDSATAQFFVNVVDNAMLDAENTPDGNGYAVFGNVVSGMDVIDKMRAVKTGQRGPHGDVPIAPITIKKASLEK